MNLVIFGPQGAGKGTQGKMISEKYGIPSISTGDIFRWAIAEGSDLGNQVRDHVEAGELVPDDLTIRVIAERLGAEDCSGGFLLDGFPRNLRQAEALDEILKARHKDLDAAIVLEVPQDVALDRLVGRAKTEGRKDDAHEDAVRRRLETYYQQTEPLKHHYAERGLLRAVDGLGAPDDVFARIAAVL